MQRLTSRFTVRIPALTAALAVLSACNADRVLAPYGAKFELAVTRDSLVETDGNTDSTGHARLEACAAPSNIPDDEWPAHDVGPLGMRLRLRSDIQVVQVKESPGAAYAWYSTPDTSLVLHVSMAGAGMVQGGRTGLRRRCYLRPEPWSLVEVDLDERVNRDRAGDTLYTGAVSFLLDSGATPGMLVLSRSRRGRDDAVAAMLATRFHSRARSSGCVFPGAFEQSVWVVTGRRDPGAPPWPPPEKMVCGSGLFARPISEAQREWNRLIANEDSLRPQAAHPPERPRH